MKPYVICHMISSLDGRLHPGLWSWSPDGSRSQWSSIYQQVHEALEGDAWIVGRVTMAEMTKAAPHVPIEVGSVGRGYHLASPNAKSYAIALDASGKLHFETGEIDGDHVVVVLGPDVPDSHLAELMADGVSYIVSESAKIDIAATLDLLGRCFGIRRLVLEGGATINGSFFAAGFVDELSLIVAPALDGRCDSSAFIIAGAAGLANEVQLSLTSCEALEYGLVHLRYTVLPVRPGQPQAGAENK